MAALIVPGPFPLALYCPTYNGLSYENLLVLEWLASQGYLVASISSVGKVPGYMTINISLHLGNRTVTVEKVAVHFAYNRYDSLLLRLNVCQLKKDVSTHNLLSEQVLVRWGKQAEPVTFDLAQRPLAMTGSVLMAVEISGRLGRRPEGIVFIGGLPQWPLLLPTN